MAWIGFHFVQFNTERCWWLSTVTSVIVFFRILIRPHPAIWRLVHGMAVVYLVALTFLLFQVNFLYHFFILLMIKIVTSIIIWFCICYEAMLIFNQLNNLNKWGLFGCTQCWNQFDDFGRIVIRLNPLCALGVARMLQTSLRIQFLCLLHRQWIKTNNCIPLNVISEICAASDRQME